MKNLFKAKSQQADAQLSDSGNSVEHNEKVAKRSLFSFSRQAKQDASSEKSPNASSQSPLVKVLVGVLILLVIAYFAWRFMEDSQNQTVVTPNVAPATSAPAKTTPPPAPAPNNQAATSVNAANTEVNSTQSTPAGTNTSQPNQVAASNVPPANNTPPNDNNSNASAAPNTTQNTSAGQGSGMSYDEFLNLSESKNRIYIEYDTTPQGGTNQGANK